MNSHFKLLVRSSWSSLLFALWALLFIPRAEAAVGAVPLTILCPSNITVWTCQQEVIIQYPLPTVTGGCSGYQVTCTPPSGFAFPLGVTTVNCRAIDSCQNTATCSFDIAVRLDTEPPSIRCPDDVTVFACQNPAGGCGTVVNYPSPIATDNSGSVAVSCNPPSGSFFLCGETPVNCVAIDRCEHVTACRFLVTVKQGGSAPSIECPEVIDLFTCSNSVVLSYPPPLVNPATATVVCTPPPGTIVPIGLQPIICVASTECGTNVCQFVVAVRQSPSVEIRCPTNIVATAPCGSNCVQVFYPDPAVLNGALERCIPPSGSCFPIGVQSVVCRATNGCGGVLCEFSVRVIQGQGEPPRILCPSNIVASTCGSNSVAVSYPPPTVFPGSDPNPTVVCTPPSGSPFPPGATTVICRATDQCGNETKCEFQIIVRPDVLPPVIQCPSNIVICVPTTVNGREVGYTVTATDDTDPAPEVTCVPPPGSFFPLGTTVVNCRATDKCGNESKCSFTVSVLPTRPPTLSIAKEGNSIVVCWTKVCGCYKLQATRSLSRPIVWVDVVEEPDDFGSSLCVRLPWTAGHRFFRLISCDQPMAPIYGVVGAGLTRAQVARLADALQLPPDLLHVDEGGGLSFLDPLRFQAIPTDPIQDPALIEELRKDSETDKGELGFDGINFEKLKGIEALPAVQAIALFQDALKQAELLPANGEPEANHSMFEAVDEKGGAILEPHAIDTHVNFHFNLGGIPLIGPGAMLSLALSPEGRPTALQFALRQLQPIQDVPILPIDEAARRCAKLYPGLRPNGAPQLVYFAPSLLLPAVQKVIPCYVCGGDAPVDGQQVSLLRSIIPATEDPALVPKLALQAVSQGNFVSARAVVEGGLPPYSFQWSSSTTDLGTLPPDASSIEYLARPRGDETSETVRVVVTDANGVVVQDSQTVRILGGATGPGFIAAVGGITDYGTERAVSDMGAGNQSGWNSRMDSDGVVRRFNFSGLGAWERDFKEGGTGLDHLYADNADIVFYIGHGYGGGFTFESMHDDDQIYYTDAAGAWGDLDLEWLALLSCQVLKDDWSGHRWWQRWGPAFDGLHLLLGFETNAHDWPAFGGTFADWMLGRHIGFVTLPGMPVRASWFLAKAQQQPAADIAVAIGVLGPAGCSNYNDYFWGKGPVGPDIRGANIHGYWRVTYQ